MADDPDQRSQKQGTTATTPGADGASTNSSSVSSPPDSPALEAAAPTNGFIFTGSSYSGMNVESTAVAATPAATSVSASTGSQGVVFVAGPGTGPAATNTTMAVAPMPTATSVLVPAAQSPSSGPDTPDSSIVEEVDSKFALNNELNKTCNEKSFREGMDVTGPQYRDMNQNAVAIWDEYYTNAPAVYDRRFAETTLIVELLWRCKWLYDAYLAVIEGGHPEWANRALNWRFWRIYRNVRNSVRTRETTDNLEQRDKTGRGNQIDGHHFDYCKEDLLKEYWTNEPEDPLNLGSIQRQAQPDHSTTASAKRDRAIAGAPRARTAAPRPAQSSLTAAPSFAERLPSVRQMLQSDNIKQGGRQRANGSNLASSFNGFKNDSGVTTDEVDAPMSGVGDDRAAPAALPDAEPPMPPNGSTHVDATAGPEREEHKVTGQETSAPQGSRETSSIPNTAAPQKQTAKTPAEHRNRTAQPNATTAFANAATTVKRPPPAPVRPRPVAPRATPQNAPVRQPVFACAANALHPAPTAGPAHGPQRGSIPVVPARMFQRTVAEVYVPPPMPPPPRNAAEARQQLDWYLSERNERNYQYQRVDAILAEGQRAVLDVLRWP